MGRKLAFGFTMVAGAIGSLGCVLTRQSQRRAEPAAAGRGAQERAAARDAVKRVLEKYKETGLEALQDVATLYYHIGVTSYRTLNRNLRQDPVDSPLESDRWVQGIKRNGSRIFEDMGERRKGANGKAYERAVGEATAAFKRYLGDAHVPGREDLDRTYSEAATRFTNDAHDLYYEVMEQATAATADLSW